MHHGGSWRGLHSFLSCSLSCSDRTLARSSIIQCVWLASAQPDDAAMIWFCSALVLVLTAPRPRLSPICVSMLCAARDFFAHGIDWNSCCVLVVPEVLQQIGSSSFSAYSNIPVVGSVSYIPVFLISVIIIFNRSDPILCLVSAKSV